MRERAHWRMTKHGISVPLQHFHDLWVGVPHFQCAWDLAEYVAGLDSRNRRTLFIFHISYMRAHRRTHVHACKCTCVSMYLWWRELLSLNWKEVDTCGRGRARGSSVLVRVFSLSFCRFFLFFFLISSYQQVSNFLVTGTLPYNILTLLRMAISFLCVLHLLMFTIIRNEN